MGPFEVQRGLDGATRRIVLAKSGEVVATILEGPGSDELAKAIAALPEVLEGLRLMVGMVESDDLKKQFGGAYVEGKGALVKAGWW